MAIFLDSEKSKKRITLTSGEYSCEISEHGAELKSLKKGDKEYMWQADPAFWGRTAPVLFPIVGGLKNKLYRVKEKTYSLGQHGFARDLDFTLRGDEGDYAIFELQSSPSTLEKYPYEFLLAISYKLEKNKLTVTWRVENIGKDRMFFSVGGHPAFNAEINETVLKLFKDGKQVTTLTNSIFEDGLVSGETEEVSLKNGEFRYETHTFDNDAFIVENNQADRVELYDGKGNRQVAVCFEAPLFGLWAPVGKPAPFICIEPWYGLADSADFEGDYSEKKWINTLGAGAAFEKSFTIEVF